MKAREQCRICTSRSCTIKRLRRAGAAILFHGRRKKQVTRTVLSLTKLAVHSKSNVKLRYKGADGESLILSMTSPQAHMVQEVVTYLKKRKHDRSAIRGRSVVGNEETIDSKEIGDAFARLAQLPNGQFSSLEFDDVMNTLIDVLKRNHMIDLVPVLAADLEARGHPEAARRLREAAAR
jgi:hypothetical protein